MNFRYLRDPLFLFSVALFAANRWILKPHLSWPILHNSLNDLLCIPVWVPFMLYVMRRFKMRDNDGPPTGPEILVPLIFWSFVFEVWLPHVNLGPENMVGDPKDVLAYAAGAAAAWMWWNGRELLGREGGAPAAQGPAS